MQEPTILYQDPSVIIVNKPAGLLVHAASREGGDAPTLAGWIAERFPQVAEVGELHDPSEGEEIARGGIVHRLDRDTSGVMVIAATQKAFDKLKRQFAEHEARKTYRTFVYGIVNEDRGVIDKPIGRGRGSGSSRSARDPHGTLREARTTFRTISRGADRANPGNLESRASYLEVFPETGRTHQIRVHLSFIHHPVVHDPLYAPGRPALLGFDRLALHAYKLAFIHPATREQVSFTAPLPADFEEAEKRLATQG